MQWCHVRWVMRHGAIRKFEHACTTLRSYSSPCTTKYLWDQSSQGRYVLRQSDWSHNRPQPPCRGITQEREVVAVQLTGGDCTSPTANRNWNGQRAVQILSPVTWTNVNTSGQFEDSIQISCFRLLVAYLLRLQRIIRKDESGRYRPSRAAKAWAADSIARVSWPNYWESSCHYCNYISANSRLAFISDHMR